jgi:hypothetical protein
MTISEMLPVLQPLVAKEVAILQRSLPLCKKDHKLNLLEYEQLKVQEKPHQADRFFKENCQGMPEMIKALESKLAKLEAISRELSALAEAESLPAIPTALATV